MGLLQEGNGLISGMILNQQEGDFKEKIPI